MVHKYQWYAIFYGMKIFIKRRFVLDTVSYGLKTVDFILDKSFKNWFFVKYNTISFYGISLYFIESDIAAQVLKEM